MAAGRNLFATTNARVVGAFCMAALLHLAGTVLIPGYSAPFAIRAILVLSISLNALPALAGARRGAA